MIPWSEATVLVTGGTGSFGHKLVEILLNEYHPKKVIVFSRDEWKQHEMRINGFNHRDVRYFLGDVRDLERLRRATKGVDYIFHAAALKQVPACEYNPMEAVATNINGSRNVIDAALDNGVRRVVMISTDKATAPMNLYGATKLVAEKLCVHANNYAAGQDPRFACVRYGNVLGSRGSVVPLFLEQRQRGRLTLTDPRMTRFWVTLDQCVRFVLSCLQQMRGGEVFIPKLPSMRLVDLARALAPEAEIEYVGIRPGEKLHESMLSEFEARETVDTPEGYVLLPPDAPPIRDYWNSRGRALPEGFVYASDTNDRWMTAEELLELVPECEPCAVA